MKPGDLVKMTYMSFWMKKNQHAGAQPRYTEVPMLVLETYKNAVKVMMPDGKVRSDLAENYEVISEI